MIGIAGKNDEIKKKEKKLYNKLLLRYNWRGKNVRFFEYFWRRLEEIEVRKSTVSSK